MSAIKINNANQDFVTKAFVMVTFLILSHANNMMIVLTWFAIKKFVEFHQFSAKKINNQVLYKTL